MIPETNELALDFFGEVWRREYFCFVGEVYDQVARDRFGGLGFGRVAIARHLTDDPITAVSSSFDENLERKESESI